MAYPGQVPPRRGARHARPHRHHLRRLRLHRPLRRPSAWLAPAGGCAWRCAARRGRTSFAPTASSARSSRSRPTSATRPRPARAIAGAEAVDQLRRHPGRGRQADLRGGDRRGRRPDRPARRRGGRRAARPRLRDRRRPRRATASTPPPRAEARRRCARPSPAAVILRPSIVFGDGRQLLQPVRRDGAAVAGAAAGRPGDALPAGLCRRRRRRGGPRPPPTPRRPASTSSAARRSRPSAS